MKCVIGCCVTFSSSSLAVDTFSVLRLDLVTCRLCRRRAEHRLIFLYKYYNNLFSHTFNLDFNKDTHNYNTGTRNNTRKTLAKRNWDLWTSLNFASNEWNQLDMNIRKMSSLTKIKKAIRKADINLNSNLL